MNVVYVHGFGGARGQLERAMADVARGGPHALISVHWPSGDLREMRARAVVEVARKVAEKKSLRRGLFEAALQGGRQASEAWEQAVANVPAGAVQLAMAIEAAQATGRPSSVVAFSLGCRVVLHAIAAGALPPGSVQRFVFAGSAAPASAYASLADQLPTETSIVHIWSRRDAVLDRLYPLGESATIPSGRAPLGIPGIEDVEVDVGHRGYRTIAQELWRYAVGEESVAVSVDPPARRRRSKTRSRRRG